MAATELSSLPEGWTKHEVGAVTYFKNEASGETSDELPDRSSDAGTPLLTADSLTGARLAPAATAQTTSPPHLSAGTSPAAAQQTLPADPSVRSATDSQAAQPNASEGIYDASEALVPHALSPGTTSASSTGGISATAAQQTPPADPSVGSGMYPQAAQSNASEGVYESNAAPVPYVASPRTTSASSTGDILPVADVTCSTDWFPLRWLPVEIQKNTKFEKRDVQLWSVAGPALKWAVRGFVLHWIPTLIVPFFHSKVLVYLICGISIFVCVSIEFKVSTYTCFVYSQVNNTTGPLHIISRHCKCANFKVWLLWWAGRAFLAHSEILLASNFVRHELGRPDFKEEDKADYIRKTFAGLVYFVLVCQFLRTTFKVASTAPAGIERTFAGMERAIQVPRTGIFGEDDIQAITFEPGPVGITCTPNAKGIGIVQEVAPGSQAHGKGIRKKTNIVNIDVTPFSTKSKFSQEALDLAENSGDSHQITVIAAVSDQQYDSLGSVCWWLMKRAFSRFCCVSGPTPFPDNDPMSKEIALNNVVLDARMNSSSEYNFYYNEKRMQESYDKKIPSAIEHRLRHFSERYTRNVVFSTNLTAALILLTESLAFSDATLTGGEETFYIECSLLFALMQTVIRLVSIWKQHVRLKYWIGLAEKSRHDNPEAAPPYHKDNMKIAKKNSKRIFLAAVIYVIEVGIACFVIGYTLVQQHSSV